MARQHRNANNNIQGNIFPPESINPTALGPERCNTAEAQDKDCKIAATNMFKDLKEDVNKSVDEIYENIME